MIGLERKQGGANLPQPDLTNLKPVKRWEIWNVAGKVGSFPATDAIDAYHFAKRHYGGKGYFVAPIRKLHPPRPVAVLDEAFDD